LCAEAAMVADAVGRQDLAGFVCNLGVEDGAQDAFHRDAILARSPCTYIARGSNRLRRSQLTGPDP
jgi:hypothetical protein